MANYDWREKQNFEWWRRFPDDARGADVWLQHDFDTSSDLNDVFSRLREARRQAPPKPLRPCLFVSHRKDDADEAARVAYLACEAGFDYWLDVLDPNLVGMKWLPGVPLTAQEAAATAAIIEMALLNATHVLAVITSNTNGSQWVPYEYGRVKEPSATSLQAACWVDKDVRKAPLPEYLYLGPILKSEADITHWLKTEFQKSGRVAKQCGWPPPHPDALP